jgi:hypothetical protein
VGGDPVNLVDPSGNIPVIPILIGVAIGASLDLAFQKLIQKRRWCEIDVSSVVTSGILGGFGVGVGALISKAGMGLIGYLSANSLAGGLANTAATAVNNAIDGRNISVGTGSAFLGGAAFSAAGAGIGMGAMRVAGARIFQSAAAKNSALKSWLGANAGKAGVQKSGLTNSEILTNRVKPAIEGVGFSVSNVLSNFPSNPFESN